MLSDQRVTQGGVFLGGDCRRLLAHPPPIISGLVITQSDAPLGLMPGHRRIDCK